MNDREQRMAEELVSIFEKVLVAEEKSLQKGYFSNLSLAEMHTLDAIGPYEARTMTETAQILGITVGTLTVSVDRLVRKGFVERRRDEEDRRVVRISLTRDGKLAARMHGKFHKVLAKHILEPYNEQEQDLLLSLVSEVDEYLNTQVARYDNNDKIRQTAKDVAKDVRRRKKDD
jgi:DNA-binding MarR family transcriptional regulator